MNNIPLLGFLLIISVVIYNLYKLLQVTGCFGPYTHIDKTLEKVEVWYNGKMIEELYHTDSSEDMQSTILKAENNAKKKIEKTNNDKS